MTYFGFLAVFLGPPLLILAALSLLDRRNQRQLPASLSQIPAWLAVLIHVGVAVAYTTPWDNYLVATGVWYYRPELVSGVTLGWVPLEEYLFFVLQTLMVGLWLLYLARRLRPGGVHSPRPWRPSARVILLLLLLWLCAVTVLAVRFSPAVYLALILVWALPPIALQLIFGADILWRRRHLILFTLISSTLYLGLADTLAIRSGTWTISPDQSLNLYLAGGLPIEELIFFLATNTLLVFGMLLALSRESVERFRVLKSLFFKSWSRDAGREKGLKREPSTFRPVTVNQNRKPGIKETRN
jgi:lycopene cyclase domain-containing protein